MYNIPQEMIDGFTDKMRVIHDSDSGPEDAHIQMDNAMCEILTKLGFGDGIDIFNHTEMWYS